MSYDPGARNTFKDHFSSIIVICIKQRLISLPTYPIIKRACCINTAIYRAISKQTLACRL